MKRMTSGGGWAAILYTLRMARKVGFRQLWRAMRSKNACKTCALGMGGQAGGMRNEAGHWPEVCKKSLQAMVGDMQAGLKPEFFQRFSLAELRSLTPRELEWCGRLTQPVFAGSGDTHYRGHWLGRGLGPRRRQARATPPGSSVLLRQRPLLERGRLPAATLRAALRHQLRQQLLLLLPPGQRRRPSRRSLGTGTATVTLDDVEKTGPVLPDRSATSASKIIRGSCRTLMTRSGGMAAR